MTLIRSFPPLENPDARVLILGSMPGIASLRAGQYYAHPQNAFWPIMGALVGADPSLPYEQRVHKLAAAGIALWDVLAACTRESSLDADIVKDSIVANDFASFFGRHPRVKSVLFNGSMAEQSFLRHVAPSLHGLQLRLQRLPSTSPAHASLTRQQKLAAWRMALRTHGIIVSSAREKQ